MFSQHSLSKSRLWSRDERLAEFETNLSPVVSFHPFSRPAKSEDSPEVGSIILEAGIEILRTAAAAEDLLCFLGDLCSIGHLLRTRIPGLGFRANDFLFPRWSFVLASDGH